MASTVYQCHLLGLGTCCPLEGSLEEEHLLQRQITEEESKGKGSMGYAKPRCHTLS